MRFEWDPAKAAANLRKHGVSFEEAETCFRDAHADFLPDLTHADRAVLVGYSEHGRLLMVVHVEKSHDTYRIISARRATPSERRAHEEG